MSGLKQFIILFRRCNGISTASRASVTMSLIWPLDYADHGGEKAKSPQLSSRSLPCSLHLQDAYFHGFFLPSTARMAMRTLPSTSTSDSCSTHGSKKASVPFMSSDVKSVLCPQSVHPCTFL